MIGLLVFGNKVKEEAKELIEKLKIANIESRMITGDNIFVAVETAIRCGILNSAEKITVFQGRNQLSSQSDKIFRGKVLERVNGFVKQEECFLD